MLIVTTGFKSFPSKRMSEASGLNLTWLMHTSLPTPALENTQQTPQKGRIEGKCRVNAE